MTQVSGNQYGTNLEVNSLMIIGQANDLSKTDHQEIMTLEKQVQNSQSVYSNEVGLDVDRSVASIGRFPSEFHNYELLAKGLEFYAELSNFSGSQAEMVINLLNPTGILFVHPSFFIFTHEYLSTAFNCDIYVTNDENLYREEMVINPNTETPLNVIDYEDLKEGLLPESVNLIAINTSFLANEQNELLLEKLYESLPSKGVIMLFESNDYYNLYQKKSEHYSYQLHTRIKDLPGARCYHVPTFIGYTIVIKN